jgi:hypothetical protein
MKRLTIFPKRLKRPKHPGLVKYDLENPSVFEVPSRWAVFTWSWLHLFGKNGFLVRTLTLISYVPPPIASDE